MRVIGGQFRSRALKSVKGMDVRPTPDRMRETLFNILAPILEGAVFVDVYAGTGAVGIEALSRGARQVVFIEQSSAALAVIRANLISLGITGEAQVVAGKAAALVTRYPADIVFIDPPYSKEREYQTSMEALGQCAEGLVIVQHASRFDVGQRWGKLERSRVVKQGENSLTFYRGVEGHVVAP